MPTRLGWSARWNEPGGFLYDSKARLRGTAKWVIALTSVAIALQVFWMYLLFAEVVPEWMVQKFIYQAIFFTLLTNIVAWAFVNLTWKYARDSQKALDEYSGDLEMQMRELGFTLMDLNDIGQAIKASGMTAEGVTEAIRVFRDFMAEVNKAGLRKEDFRALVKEIPKLRRAADTEKRLRLGDFSIFEE